MAATQPTQAAKERRDPTHRIRHEVSLGACFLMLFGPEPERAALMAKAARWLPFVPERDRVIERNGGSLALWSVYDEAARGSYWHVEGDEPGPNPDASSGDALAYHGWWVEPAGAGLDRSVAAVLHDEVQRRGLEATLAGLEGDGIVLHYGRDGAFAAGNDLLGTSHLYYGRRGPWTAISNRAMMAAAALHGGTLPAARPEVLAWLASGPRAPIGTKSAFADVELLGPHHTLRRDAPTTPHPEPPLRLLARPEPAPAPGAADDWQVLAEELQRRCRQIARLPDVRFEMTLTGGKDSRLVLAGLVAAGALPSVRGCYFEGVPEHPDARVCVQLASHFGLGVRYRETVIESLDWQESLALHNAQVELVFGAFDRKGWHTLARGSTIGGNYGEIFRGHAQLRLGLSADAARRFYASPGWLNRWGLLSPRAHRVLADEMLAWLEPLLTAGVPGLALHDRWHRECRMQRWVGQAMQADGVAHLWLHPLALRTGLARYLALPWLDRQTDRVHFELTRRCDDWLWRQPFARQRWAPHLTLTQWRPGGVVRGSTTELEPPLRAWQRGGAAILDELDSRRDDGFYDWVDAPAVSAMTERLRHRQSRRDLANAFNLVGLRVALGGVAPAPTRLAAR